MLFAVPAGPGRVLSALAAGVYLCSALCRCAVYDERRVLPLSAAASPAAAGSSSELPPLASLASETTPESPAAVDCSPLTEHSPCELLPRLPAAPVLDGAPECALVLHTLAQGERAAPAARAVRYAAAFTDTGLYLYVAVSGLPVQPHAADQPLFCGDAVELFVDADGVLDAHGAYESSGTMQFVVGAPVAGGGIEAGKFMQGKPFGPWVSKGLWAAATPDGYAVEALISASDLGMWDWQPTGQLGFDLAVDFAGSGASVESVCATARTQLLLKVANEAPPCAGQPWCDTRSFCVPRLAQ